ncbi:hypothetical protein, partial [Streptomyces sp. NPDC058622]
GEIDPETGQPVAAGASAGGAGNLLGIPVTTSAGIGGGLQTALMALCAAVLLGVVVGPPLVTRQLARRRAGEGS